MYLAEQDLRAALPALNFDTEDAENGFEEAKQIQPCSIDIRLDGTFWKPRRGASFDLLNTKLGELNPTTQWEMVTVGRGERLTLKRGQMVLGRTFEKFSIPPDCAGKLEGKSSYSRMGLAVHCTGDFINPGWRGRMPVPLINQLGRTIRVTPYIPVCQLLLVKLTQVPSQLYGDMALGSKYIDDDGGPSKWWRDRHLKEIRSTMGDSDVADAVQRRLCEVIEDADPGILERFTNFVKRLPREECGNADEMLRRFQRAEERSKRFAVFGRAAPAVIATPLVSKALGSLASDTWGRPQIGWAAAAAAATLFAIVYYFSCQKLVPGPYLTADQLATLLRRHKSSPAGSS